MRLPRFGATVREGVRQGFVSGVSLIYNYSNLVKHMQSPCGLHNLRTGLRARCYAIAAISVVRLPLRGLLLG